MQNRGGLSLLQGIAGYGWFAIIALGSISASDCFAVEPSLEQLSVEIENISFLGNNKYRADIAVYNRSDKTALLKEHSETFYVQTEILGQWKELSASSAGADRSARLGPLKGLQIVHILNIPPDIPDLYTNNEGEINMKFKYMIRFIVGPETDARSQYGESSYWITPETNTWILREGM